MRHLIPLFAVTVILTLTAPAPVSGEDGLYCLGTDYLAYQLRHPTETSRQQLTVVRLDPLIGIIETRTHEIEAFPVLGIRCLKEDVDLLAWDRIRRVNLKEGERAEPSRVEPDPEDSLLPDFSDESLNSADESTREVPLKIAEGRFTLVIAKGGPRLRHDLADDSRSETPLPTP